MAPTRDRATLSLAALRNLHATSFRFPRDGSGRSAHLDLLTLQTCAHGPVPGGTQLAVAECMLQATALGEGA